MNWQTLTIVLTINSAICAPQSYNQPFGRFGDFGSPAATPKSSSGSSIGKTIIAKDTIRSDTDPTMVRTECQTDGRAQDVVGDA